MITNSTHPKLIGLHNYPINYNSTKLNTHTLLTTSNKLVSSPLIPIPKKLKYTAYFTTLPIIHKLNNLGFTFMTNNPSYKEVRLEQINSTTHHELLITGLIQKLFKVTLLSIISLKYIHVYMILFLKFNKN